jgi:hypothetical protein
MVYNFFPGSLASMSPEKKLQKLKKDVSKSRAEIAALQRKLKATLLKRTNSTANKSRPKSAD